MWKTSMAAKKTAVLVVAAMALGMMAPEHVYAQEQNVSEPPAFGVQNGEINAETESQAVEDAYSAAPYDADGNVNDIQKTPDGQDIGAGKEISEDDNSGNETGDTDIADTETGGIPELPGAVAVPMPMDSTDNLYEGLSQFLSLGSDQYQIYTVAIIDPATGQPVQPVDPVQISLDVPSVYDTDRLVVSEISMDGETPSRMEFPFTYSSGKAVFESDHSGIYVVMEKKVQVKLPHSFDLTSKVEKLELTKKYYGSESLASSIESPNLNPQTGDDNSVLIWGIVTAAAAAAVIVLAVIIIIKRRK